MAQSVGEIKAKLTVDTQQFNQGMDQAKNKMTETSRSANLLETSMLAVGMAARAVGAAAVTAIGASVGIAASFEQSMARVQAVSGATDEQLSQLEDTARELGATTEFSAGQAAEGMSYLAMAGFEVNEIIESMPGVLNLASAAQIELGQSADIVSNIMTGFGMSANETDRAVDVLVQTMRTANTDLPQLGGAMSYVAPIAASLGWTIEETAAAVGRMSDAGIQGQRAGTALRAALLSLANPVGQTAKAMDELGINITNAEGAMLPLPELIDEINSATEDMTETQRAQAIAQLVGTEAASGFIALLDQGGGSIADYTKELENSAGAAEEVASVQRDTLMGSFKEFQSALEEVGISIGQEFLPRFKGMVDAATDLVRWLGDLNPEVVATGLKMTAASSGVALMASALTRVVSALKGLSLSPIGLIITGVSVLAGAFVGLRAATEESIEASLEKVSVMIEEQSTLEDTIEKYEDLRGRSKLTTDELARWVDIQRELQIVTDPEVIQELQEEMAQLEEKSGLSNEELNKMVEYNDLLIEKVPESEVVLTEQGEALLKNTDAARKVNDELREMIILELDAQRARAEAKLDEYMQNYKDAIEEANRAVEKRNEGIIELSRLEFERNELLLEQEQARRDGLDGLVEIIEREIERKDALIQGQKNLNAELADEVFERIKAVDESAKELENVQSIYDEMVNVELQQFNLNAARGEGVDVLNEEIGRLVAERAELEKNTSESDKKTDKYRESIAEIDKEIERLRDARNRVQDIYNEQNNVNNKIREGTDEAGELNEVLSEDQLKNIKFTGDGLIEAKQITDELGRPVDKRVNIFERVTRSIRRVFSGGSYHHGGIVGRPELHNGGTGEDAIRQLQRRIEDYTPPMYNEVDVRLLRNEMVLTEAQQAQLFRMLDTPTSGAIESVSYDQMESAFFNAIKKSGIDRDPDIILNIDGRQFARTVHEYITEEQERKQDIERRFRG